MNVVDAIEASPVGEAHRADKARGHDYYTDESGRVWGIDRGDPNSRVLGTPASEEMRRKKDWGSVQ